ncbi:hypothetical protein AM270_26775 [Escherichia coli]|nr:hypothetical protein AM270_26775 [Escherichia coli]
MCYEPKTLDTQNAANGGEMGAGSDTGVFFVYPDHSDKQSILLKMKGAPAPGKHEILLRVPILSYSF